MQSKDQLSAAAFKRGEPWAYATAWIGGLAHDELRHVAHELTSPELLDEADLDELRAILPADISQLWWGDKTDPVSLDTEGVYIKTPDGSLVTVQLRRDDGGWLVVAVTCEPGRKD